MGTGAFFLQPRLTLAGILSRTRGTFQSTEEEQIDDQQGRSFAASVSDFEWCRGGGRLSCPASALFTGGPGWNRIEGIGHREDYGANTSAEYQCPAWSRGKHRRSYRSGRKAC